MGNMEVDVNWNEHVTPCKKIRFKLDGKEQIIDREDLYAMMMLFGNDNQQTDLIPVIETKVRAITRLLKIRAKKDMRRGEIMAFPYTYFVPAAVYEKLLLDSNYSSANVLSTPDLGKIVRKEK